MKKLAADLTEEELKNKYEGFTTVGELLDFIEKNNIHREGKILMERVEDWYFDEGRWKTIKKNVDVYINTLALNRKWKI